MQKFYCPNIDDKRIYYAVEYLEKLGYYKSSKLDNCDFVLLGINPTDFQSFKDYPVFAGNVCANSVFDYTKVPEFALENAFLTAEGALALAIKSSEISLINSNVLIIGYGKIAQALHNILNALNPNITVCARNPVQLSKANMMGANPIGFEQLKKENDFDFVFNTVPHPVLNEKELNALKNECVILDLASFPGGVDAHYAKLKEKIFLQARGLPALYSPKSAGIIVAKAVAKMIEGRG